MSPHQFTAGELVAGNHLLVATLLLGIEEIPTHREGRPTGPDGPPPQCDRRLPGPVGLNAHAANDAVAFRPAKARPVYLRFRPFERGRVHRRHVARWIWSSLLGSRCGRWSRSGGCRLVAWL